MKNADDKRARAGSMVRLREDDCNASHGLGGPAHHECVAAAQLGGGVYLANAVGAVGLALIVYWSGHAGMNGGAVGLQYVKIAVAKTSLPFAEAFFKGVLCNLLVCLAVWLAMAGRSVTDKLLAIIFPISAFVAAGFEHSVANKYLIPMGILLRASAPQAPDSLDWAGLAANLLPVTLGNIAGGSVLVALVYFIIYRHGKYGW